MSTSRITNTTSDPLSPMLVLLDGLGGGGGSGAIEAMEARGQRELVRSDRLPTDNSNGDGAHDEPYLALGFTFGEPDEKDLMFRPATLPDGWRKERSDHDMWSYIVDQLGRRRVSVFYKAAYYDRHAFMRLDSHETYLSSCVRSGTAPVLDSEWLTVDTAAAVLATTRDEHLARAERYAAMAAKEADPSYWNSSAQEERDHAATAQRFIDHIGQS